MVKDIFVWLVLGLLAGGLAKLLMPGNQKGGCLLTILLGIAGALVGGFLGRLLNLDYAIGEFDLAAIVSATLGALLILFGFRALAGAKDKPRRKD